MNKRKKLIKLIKFSNESMKRVFDIGVSTVALVALSPVLIFISYKVKKEDKGPTFYPQIRSGLNNAPFIMYKIRSMKQKNNVIETASSKIEKPYTYWKGKVPDDFVFKTINEQNPNVTKIGVIIRKYSMDELPQLFNVLKGDMSIVGPRPEIVEITKYYNEEQMRRLKVKPGITGWAQVNGRSNMNHGSKISYDLYYVENWNFWLDIKILFKTIRIIINGNGSV